MTKKIIILSLLVLGLALTSCTIANRKIPFTRADDVDLKSGGRTEDPISISAVVGADNVTYIVNQTNDFAIGGTDSSAAFWFDESAGDLTITGDLAVVDVNPSGNVSITGTLEVTDNASTTGTLYVRSSIHATSTSVFDGVMTVFNDVNLLGDALTFDMTTVTPTTSEGLYIRGGLAGDHLGTSTISIGETGDSAAADSPGCLEMVREGAYYNCFILTAGTGIICEAGRCNEEN